LFKRKKERTVLVTVQ